MIMRHYVYLHRKADNGEPFYVGKGVMRRREPYRRANVKARRSAHWQRTVAKYGVLVEIVAHFVSDADAQVFEKQMIAEIGRADLKRGPLVNLTDGGDGHCGLIVPESTLRKRSENAKRPRSKAWIDSIRRARAGGGNGGVVKKGDKLPQSWRNSIAATKRGARNPMFGRCGSKHPRGRAVTDSVSGASYPTVTVAAAAIGLRVQTLHNMLTGFRQNHTAMRFA